MNKKVVLICMAVGIVVMLGASFMKRISDPDLVRQTRGSAPTQADSGGMDAEPMGGGGMSPEVGNLMQKLKDSPNDIPTLIHLSERLIESGELNAAENFIHRLIELAPKNAQGHYLHGIVLYNSGKHDEALKSFEQVVALSENASARYSIGIIHIYHFKNLEKGIAEFEKALSDPNANDELKNVVRAELEKAKATKTQ